MTNQLFSLLMALGLLIVLIVIPKDKGEHQP